MNPSPNVPPLTFWHRLDRFLARLRPHREPLSLVVDGVLVVLAWNVTYLFRLGFERWLEARPWYDPWVLLGIVAAYLGMFALLKVPQGMWRFSGFGEVKRLTWGCLVAGVCSASPFTKKMFAPVASVTRPSQSSISASWKPRLSACFFDSEQIM